MLRMSFLFAFVLLLAQNVYSQRASNKLNLSGTVLGYTFDDSKGLFNRNKTLEVEGSVPNVWMEILDIDGVLVNKTTSSSSGEFSVNLELGSKYEIVYGKATYGTSAFKLDLTGIKPELADAGLMLNNIELILNSYKTDKPQDNGKIFGSVFFNNTKEQFVFKPTVFDKKEKLFKEDEDNTAFNLMYKSLSKNATINRMENIDIIEPVRERRNNNASSFEVNQDSTTTKEGNQVDRKKKELKSFQSFDLIKAGMSQEDIQNYAATIEDAKAALAIEKANAVTESDFVLIAAKERLIQVAEKELENAKLFIEEQEEKLAAKQQVIYALIGIIILVIGLIFLLWRTYIAKKKNHQLLADKNKKITDSIQYAQKIQQSVLLSREQLALLLPKSFLLYLPLDTVSGDFYWLAKVGNKIVIAAIDCTGHGVPGAFMSLIGNTLMNKIVLEEKETRPGEILKKLNQGVIKSLKQIEDDQAAQDGMDAAICVWDLTAKELIFSGAMNPIYILRDGEVEELASDFRGIGGFMGIRKMDKPFSEVKYALKNGDRLYLFSDGYMDQFGGAKNEKFNISRFKELIKDLSSKDMGSQENIFESHLKTWRGNQPQLDDILVMGFEV